MRFKRRRNLSDSALSQTFGTANLLITSLIILVTCSNVFLSVGGNKLYGGLQQNLALVAVGLCSVGNFHHTTASLIPDPQQNAPDFVETTEISALPPLNLTLTNVLHVQSNNNTKDVFQRRLTKIPNTRSKFSRRKSRIQAPESAMNRARLLLGSLNRQNCFAKVLCGLGAREPTTKTDLFNDYVYLMEELVVDDDDDDPKSKTKTKTKGKKWGKEKKKIHTKKDKDDSDSSQSISEEDKTTDNIDDKLTDWNFLADASLAQEDPQVLKYVQLEEKRRQYKDQLPSDILFKRSGQDELPKNDTSQRAKFITEKPIALQLPPKSTQRLARKMADAVRAGKTFGGSRRQCRTFLRDRCPFDDIQMNEIIRNLRNMLLGRGQVATNSASKTTTTITANGGADGQVKAITQPGGGSKVEIILHLNQNGMPYGGYNGMSMQYPQMPTQQFAFATPPTTAVPRFNGTSVTLAPPLPPWPQLQLSGTSDPRYPGMAYPPTSYYPPTTTTTTTEATTTTTTVRSAGEEQLLDFLYGIVNFNESEAVEPTPATKQQNPQSSNPYWSAANTALDKVEDVEHQLKIRDRDSEQDEDSRSISSEEDELKSYIKSLKETLKGLSQVNNITALSEPKETEKSSEENGSSQENFAINNDDVSETVSEANNDDDDDSDDENSQHEDENSNSKPRPTNDLSKNNTTEKVISTKPPPVTLIAFPTTPRPTITTTKPTRKTSPASRPKEPQLFDEDDDDNSNVVAAVGEILFGRENQKEDNMEDDEYEPEDTSNSQQDNDEKDEESDEQLVQKQDNQDGDAEQGDIPDKSKQVFIRKPPSIVLKFEPSPAEKDPNAEMSVKEQSKLMQLSDALFPQVPDTLPSTPNRKPVKDIMEEIRIPTTKPVSNVFQTVSKIAKNKVISFDEFADDSGKTPIFPKNGNKKFQTRPHKLRYQTRRKPPMRRPLNPVKETHYSASESSEEEDEDSPLNRDDLNSDEVHNNNGTKSKNGYSSKSGPLISVPYLHPFSQSGSQQSSDIYDSVMNFMGMRPVGKQLAPPPGQTQLQQSKFQYGYSSKEEKDIQKGKSDLPPENSFTKAHLIPQPKIGISIPLAFDMMGRDAIEETHESKGEESSEEEEDCHKKSKGKKKKKKKKGRILKKLKKKKKKKDKKCKDKKDKKKKHKKKDKKKKSKSKKSKKGKKGKGGWSSQFHQQVTHPDGHQEPSLWDKIKVFVDALANSQNDASEMPFVHFGFSENDPLDGSPHAVIQHAAPEYHHGGGGGGDSDEDTGEDEEDDIGDAENYPPRKKDEHLDNSAPVSSAEYEGIDYDENDEESAEVSDSSDSIPSSPASISNTSSITSNTTNVIKPQTNVPTINVDIPPPVLLTPTQTRQDFVTTSSPSPPTTQKTTIAPKPPKYTLNRQQLKIKKKRQKQKQRNSTVPSSTMPPIMLFITTTTLPSASTTTTTTEQPPTNLVKPTKKRVIYKAPAKRVNIVPGMAIHQVTTTSKPSSSLKSFPDDMIKTRVEDDEIEPPSHFVQPGPGLTVRGRPPVNIQAFHIQSEDMLLDTEDDEKLRGGLNTRSKPPPSFLHHRPHELLRDSSTSQEEGSSSEVFPSSTVLIATPKPRPLQIHAENIIGNPEEMRGTRVKYNKRGKRKRPQHSHRPENADDSKLTSAVINSPIFSDYFKHLYTSLGQYIPTG